MSTATTTAARTTSNHSAPPSRAWARVGVLAGLSGLVGIGASMGLDAVYNEESMGDPVAIVDRLADQTPNLIVFHTATIACAILLIIFAAGLRRRLAAQTPGSSLLPDIAAGGLMLTSVAGLMGSGLNTEFIFGVNDPEARLVPEAGAFFAHWIGTIPWLWVGVGLTGVALAVAALKQSAAPRWIGWVSAILGGLTLLVGVSPLQYMAGFTGPILILIISLGFTFGDRDELT